MAKNTLYEHRFRTVSDAAEYLKAAQEDSEAACLVAIRKVMEHGLPVEEWPDWARSIDPYGNATK